MIVKHDWTEHGEPCLAIIEAMAARTDREIDDLPLLYDHVDSDALNTLVTSGNGQNGSHVEVSFEYDGHQVVVDGSGSIVIADVNERE